MISRDAILPGVIDCVAAALDIAPDGIQAGSCLIADLGADSLDLLDVVFQLEQRFGIRISPGDIERRLAAKLGDTPVAVDGAYTAEALAELRLVMPEVPPDELVVGLTQGRLPRLFRVQTMVNLVTRLAEDQGVLGASDG